MFPLGITTSKPEPWVCQTTLYTDYLRYTLSAWEKKIIFLPSLKDISFWASNTASAKAALL